MRSTSLREVRRSWPVYLLLAPSFILLLLFTYYPAVQALYESFFDWQPGSYNEFVGLKNYIRVLSDEVWWISWRNWLLFAVWHFTMPFVMPFVMAECIFNLRNRRLQAFWRVAVLVPTLIPGIVTWMLWKWMYDLDGGVNIILRAVGLGEHARPWLGHPDTALPAMMFMGFPWAVGANVLIVLAGLTNISSDIMDAATMDGCGRLRRVFAIDLPNITGVIRLFLIFGIIGVFQEFGRFLALTGGGPYFATTVPALMMFQRAFGTMIQTGMGGGSAINYGEAATIATILFVFILVFSWIGHRYVKGTGEAEGIRH